MGTYVFKCLARSWQRAKGSWQSITPKGRHPSGGCNPSFLTRNPEPGTRNLKINHPDSYREPINHLTAHKPTYYTI